MALTDRHAVTLEASAIDLDLAIDYGVRSITTVEELNEYAYDLGSLDNNGFGILFPWVDENGNVIPQIRLDKPIGEMKYAWPKGSGQTLAVVRKGPTPNSPVLLVEGMKQALAVSSVLPANYPYEVIAMAGCFGTATVDYSALMDRQVTVIFDADLSSKEGVWNAAHVVKDQLESLDCQVLFAKVPGTGDTGIDDVLGRIKTPSRRVNNLMKLLGNATDELPPPPKRKTKANPDPHHDDPDDSDTDPHAIWDLNNKFQPQNAARMFAAATAIFEGPKGIIRRYQDGVYRDATSQKEWDIITAGITGNQYSIGQGKKVYDNLIAMLWARGEYPGEFLSEPWLNCRNVMVNLATGEVMDHTPELLSIVQFGTEYDPHAECPVFDKWLAEMADTQADSLLEHISQIIDPTRAPKKHIILYGPAGTGKSTLFRIIESVMSGSYGGASEYCSAVNMDALNEGGFNTVELAGKLLNTAGEMSAKALTDITKFKTLTGDDTITADKKHHGQVTFRSKALFTFNANEIPEVKDTEPYLRRMTPFRFGNQVAMKAPDQTIEDHIRRHELPGVLNRLIQGWHRYYTRGKGYELLGPDESVLFDFKSKTNPVWGWYYSDDNPYSDEWVQSTTFFRQYQDTVNEAGGDALKVTEFWSAMDKLEGVVRKMHRLNGGNPKRCVYIPPRTGNGVSISKPEAMDFAPKGPSPDDGMQDPAPPVEISAGSAREIITFDLETIGLDMFSKPDEFVRLAGWKRDSDAEVTVSTSSEDVPLDGILVGQNVVGFDLLTLHTQGHFDLNKIVTGEAEVLDTMLLARQLFPPMARSTSVPDTERPHSLEKLAERFGFPIEKDTLKTLAKEFDTSGKSMKDPGFTGFGEIPQDDPRYIGYLKDDVVVTRQVLDKLTRDGELIEVMLNPTEEDKPMIRYVQREHKIAAIAALCRASGLRIDQELLTSRLEAQRVRREELVGILESHGMPTEGKSPHMSNAGKEAIFNALASLGVEEEHFLETEGGNISFGKDSMQNIAEIHADDEEIVQLTEVIQELAGQRSMYQQVYDCMTPDGRVHPDIDFKQASGRWSITKPGLTTVSKRGRNKLEREIFLPEPGHLFVSTDFAQVDARCVAALSQDENYMAMFEGDRDLHTEVAIACFGSGDPEFRQKAKAISHGVNYGRGAKGIAAKEGIEFELTQKFIVDYFEQFPDLRKWQDECRDLADQGRLLDNGWGRKLKADPERAYTQAPGLVGQSAARDVMCEALLRIDPEVRACLRLCIHDEFLWSIPEDKMDVYIPEIVRAMSFEWRGVQFLGEPGKPGANWLRAYDK